MALLPTPQTSLADLIYQAREKAQDRKPRPHLGASLIGDPCARKLWYGFRWVQPVEFRGKTLRLFERGQNEEEVFVRDLRSIGVEVWERDPDTGKQFTVSAHGGHFGGSLDGIGLGIPEAPKTKHVLEFKTHGDKSFKDLEKKGVKDAKPLHYAQMQIYMRRKKFDRALNMAVNKNDDSLYTERIRLDKTFADELIAKAGRIITAQNPPAGISEDPAWWECKFCEFRALCHKITDALPLPNCRTCSHSTPLLDGDKVWHCAIHDGAIPLDFQYEGCMRHCYIPNLLKPWEVMDATDSGIVYATAPKVTVENGPGGHESKLMYQAGRAFWENPVGPAIMDHFPDAEIEK